MLPVENIWIRNLNTEVNKDIEANTLTEINTVMNDRNKSGYNG